MHVKDSTKRTHLPAHHSVGRLHPNSWLPERDMLSKFGDRRSRAILAILAARRSSGRKEFFVPPQIAELFHITPRDLCWALDDLEGKVTETLGSIQGKFRKVRLLDEWEEQLNSTVGQTEQARKFKSGKFPSGLESNNSTSLPPTILDDPHLQEMLSDTARQLRETAPKKILPPSCR